MKKHTIRHLLMPFRLRLLQSKYRHQPINYLDVGCGNHSPTMTKKWFPSWNYFGIDRQDYEIDEADKAVMSGYYHLDLTRDSMSVIPEDFFDVIVLSHIIEHLPNGLEVVQDLIGKLRDGGKIYIEFPSERSLALPSMAGTLNFCDDPTHVHVYSVRELANLLLARNFRIIRAGTRRDKLRIVLLPMLVISKLLIRGGDFFRRFLGRNGLCKLCFC